MKDISYLMESEEENIRLDVKTDPSVVEEQALWAGIRPGMRVVDLGCGSGKTTSVLRRLVHPDGSVVGVDISDRRIEYARGHYMAKGIEFIRRDIADRWTTWADSTSSGSVLSSNTTDRKF